MTKKADEPIFPQDEPAKGTDMDTRLPLERKLEERGEEVEAEAQLRAELQDQLEAMRHRVDPEYRPKARAEFLRSVKVEKSYSPANRVNIVRPKGDPNVYRFNSDPVRERIGMEDWVPLTDLEEAKKVCPSAHLRKGSDGRIYSGDSYLCSQPENQVEQRNAAMFARSERKGSAAAEGKVGLGTESFADMHNRTKSSQDPVGIRFTGNLSEDNPTGS